MPRAFNSIIYRLIFFFCIGALSVGIVCPSNSPEYVRIDSRHLQLAETRYLSLLGSLGPSAARSPYTISMRRLQIPVLPDIVNAREQQTDYNALSLAANPKFHSDCDVHCQQSSRPIVT